ncbi:hypothetical protein LTS18_004342, partial [Coniosporium uncinatum]
DLLAQSPGHANNSVSRGPLISYPSLTELTRTPPSSRSPMEKNWIHFSSAIASYLFYETTPTARSYARLLGNGFTTSNLTSPLEAPCLPNGFPDPSMEIDLLDGYNPITGRDRMKDGSWHQATNSLKLMLCSRSDTECHAKPATEKETFLAVVQRKMNNGFNLPTRYERYFVLWSSVPPFEMLAVSRFPVLMANETASGFSAEENWEGDDSAASTESLVGAEEYARLVEKGVKRDMWYYFTYTVSIAWAWRGMEEDGDGKETLREMQSGYLDDDVLLGIGLNDQGQGFAKVRAVELLQCLRTCPAMEDAGKAEVANESED